MRRVWGTQARYEPKDYHDYSDHRPDLTLMADELTVYDLKVFDPLGSDSAAFSIRGAHVAFGNTLPGAREKVLGRRERGAANGKAFCPTTGEGYAAEVHGDYARTRRLGITVTLLLVEAFGGLGADLVQLLERASAIREERLEAAEYDEATWSTRKFIPFVTRRISVGGWRCSAAWRTRFWSRSTWAPWRATTSAAEQPRGASAGTDRNTGVIVGVCVCGWGNGGERGRG